MGTGLLAIVFLAILGYLTIGTYLFVALEAEDELKRQQELLQAYQNILDRFECLDRDSLKNMLEFIDQDLDMTRYLLRHNGTIQNVKWSPLGASQFAITVITTIGYGHITPRTANGRVACMVYAIFGIPLLLVFLTGIGEKLLKLSERCLTCRYGGCRSQFHQKVNFILQALVGLTILFILPTAGNMYIENWGVVESLYFNFVTLTTIGFGDLVAANPFNRDLLPNSGLISAFRWINFFWMFFGLAYISMLITAIMKYYLRSTGRVGYSASRRVKMLAQRVGQKLNCSTTRRNNRNFNTNHNDAATNDTNNSSKKKLKRTDEKQPSQSEIFSLSSATSAGDLHLDLHLTDTLASDLEVKLTKFSKLCQQVGLPMELCAELTPEELQRYHSSQSMGERGRFSNQGG